MFFKLSRTSCVYIIYSLDSFGSVANFIFSSPRDDFVLEILELSLSTAELNGVKDRINGLKDLSETLNFLRNLLYHAD